MAAKFRRFLHVAAANTLHYSGALALWRSLRRWLLRKNEVCVLGLHRVLTKAEWEQSNSLPGMIILEETYLSLLAYLRRRFEVVSLDTLLETPTHGLTFSKPLCLITFDDGWADTYSRAFPGLKKFSMPAVIFLTTGFIGTRGGFWVEQVQKAWRKSSRRARLQSAARETAEANAAASVDLERLVEWLKRMPASERNVLLECMLGTSGNGDGGADVDYMLSWDQAREMSDAGVEIGSHTVSHPLLTYEDASSVERELLLSKQILEEKLGRRVRAFAYPSGDWSERVREQAAKAGYGCAFTTQPSWHGHCENPYTISRILLHEGNIAGHEGRFSPAMFDLTLAGWA
jgi:peptidoglycan/xylan/chitin deacetylase (PgdA/CDA1 family)